MLGCKFSISFWINIYYAELIDTCWDVNAWHQARWVLPVLELIDTCWDVNLALPVLCMCFIQELIDTCWDVNDFLTISLNVDFGINRYMLGCKWNHNSHHCYSFRELIDTCWDVNSIQCTGGLAEYTELIDTCWDVNYGCISKAVWRWWN